MIDLEDSNEADDGDAPARRVQEGEGPGSPARDNWDRFAILTRPVSAVMGALVIGALGYYADQAVKQGEVAAAARVERTESYRLFTELMSRREESESLLRQEMFKAVLDEFFLSTTNPEDLARPLLKLEMLALNFGESLSLSPLFVELDKQIELMDESNGLAWIVKQRHYKRRLQSLARRVSSWQISALAVGGEVFEFDVDLAMLAKRGDDGFVYPDDIFANERAYLKELNVELTDEEEEALKVRIEDLRHVELDDISRSYRFTFRKKDKMSDRSENNRSVDVDIVITNDIPSGESARENDSPTETRFGVQMGFNLNFYNFPMIDNTRLSSDQRFAMVMTDYTKEVIKVACVVFPGSYASQRDRPFLTDVLERLKERTEASVVVPTLPLPTPSHDPDAP